MRKVFNWTNLFYFFISSNMWLTFKLPTNTIIATVSVILFVSGYSMMHGIRFGKRALILFLILCTMSVWSLMTVTVSFGILTFFYYLPAIILFILPTRMKEETLGFVTKWFGIIMSISLSIFFLTKITTLPALGTFQLTDNTFYPPYKNYLFFIQSSNILDSIIYRFNGPFLEPGHLSVVSSILLFANRYNFKGNKWLYISLACVIFSLSLAGYIITLLGYMMLTLRNFKVVIYSAVALLASYIFVTEIWNGGNNVANELIVARLAYDAEKGIVGNNRTTESTDAYFESKWESGGLWTGVGSIDKDTSIVGAGYKIYFLRFGIISAILVLCFYWNLVPKHYDKRFVYSFVIILILTFIQRAYPWWYSWLLCFTLGCGISKVYYKIYTCKTKEISNSLAK